MKQEYSVIFSNIEDVEVKKLLNILDTMAFSLYVDNPDVDIPSSNILYTHEPYVTTFAYMFDHLVLANHFGIVTTIVENVTSSMQENDYLIIDYGESKQSIRASFIENIIETVANADQISDDLSVSNIDVLEKHLLNALNEDFKDDRSRPTVAIDHFDPIEQNKAFANQVLRSSFPDIENLDKDVFGNNSLGQLFLRDVGLLKWKSKEVHHHLWCFADRDEEISNVMITIDASDAGDGARVLLLPLGKCAVKLELKI